MKRIFVKICLAQPPDRFEEGKHYYLLTGSKLKEFKRLVTISHLVSKYTSQVILWAERGAARMSKIVDTNEAWAFFEKLEDSYFRQKEQQPIAIPRRFQKLCAWLPNWLNKSSFWNRKPTS